MVTVMLGNFIGDMARMVLEHTEDRVSDETLSALLRLERRAVAEGHPLLDPLQHRRALPKEAALARMNARE